jgi:arginase family enzyme
MKIHFKGIPSNIGALNPGTELGPSHVRKQGLIDQLNSHHEVIDFNDLKMPNDLVRHNHGPIRNCPSPMIVAELIEKDLKHFFSPTSFGLLVGGGCFTLTGVFKAFHKTFKDQAKLLTIDHHIDIRKPVPNVCMGATAYTLWFLTHDNPWIENIKTFHKAQITAMGFSDHAIDENYDITDIKAYNLKTFRSNSVEAICRDYLKTLEENDTVFIHLDLDVIHQKDFSSVYMPSEDGLSLEELHALLSLLLEDSRIKGLMVTEYSGLQENNKEDAQKLVHLLEGILNDSH